MFQKIVILSAVAGIAASVPVFYQQDPERFHDLVRTVAAPAQPAAATQETGPGIEPASAGRDGIAGRRVRLPADARGHFEGDFRFNGRTMNAMIDTGATLVAINETVARRIGIRLEAADFRYEVDTANGKVRAAAAMIDNLQIGRIYVRDIQAMVLEDRALNKILVGMSFLSRLQKFQVEGGTLLLEQ